MMLKLIALQKRRCVPTVGRTRLFEFAILTTLVVLMSSASYAQTDSEQISFDIPSQSVPQALNLFSRQANVVLGFSEPGYEDVKTRAVVGSFRRERALELLLAGTGLRVSIGTGDTVIVHRASDTTTPVTGSTENDRYDSFVAQAGDSYSGSTQGAESSAAVAQETGATRGNNSTATVPILVDEIIVTGTSIRGVIPESSPLQIYDVVDIRNTGAMTAEQFVSTLPQNNNTLTDVGTGTSRREGNDDSVNSVDLRGLGVGSTLVLLNGRRMAPSSSGRSADLSFIPIAAVERVEVLTDGASSIYGADAIGGVINFVLRDQQEGAETVITFGGAEGGSEQLRLDQSFGFNWADGNALVSLSYMDRNNLDAADRSYSSAAAPFTMMPDDTRKNLLATISQIIPGGVQISADLLYSDREVSTSQTLSQFGPGNFTAKVTDHEQTVVNLEIARSFARTLNVELLATYADASSEQDAINDGPSIGVGPAISNEDSSALDITAKLDGELATFPGGPLMFALGVGYSEDEFERLSDTTALVGVNGELRSTSLDRNTKYAFAEILVPIVSSDQDIAGIRRLELSLSGRYTDYSDFGDATSPKVGVLWSPVESLKIRGTVSESFKAPFLTQLDPTGSVHQLVPLSVFAGRLPDIWSTDNSTVMMYALGTGNPTLGPEEADTQTLGFDFDRGGLNISATYFNIDYTNRIAEPDPTGGGASLAFPQDFPELFIVNPTLEEVTAILATSTIRTNLLGIDGNDPAAVHAAITVLGDNRIRNLAISEMDGLDMRFGYTAKSFGGDLNFGVTATNIFDFDEQVFASAEPLSRVDTVLYPADLKVRSNISFAKERWNARLNVNYVDEYENPFDPDNPRIEAWTTVDLLFSYEFPTEASGFSDGLRLGLTIINALDEDPPFVGVGEQGGLSLLVPTGYDPSNANPLGRFVSFQVTKRW